jgi:hypothetical protein
MFSRRSASQAARSVTGCRSIARAGAAAFTFFARAF